MGSISNPKMQLSSASQGKTKIPTITKTKLDRQPHGRYKQTPLTTRQRELGRKNTYQQASCQGIYIQGFTSGN